MGSPSQNRPSCTSGSVEQAEEQAKKDGIGQLGTHNMATSSHLEEGIDVTSGARVLECVVVTPEETAHSNTRTVHCPSPLRWRDRHRSRASSR